MEIFLTVCGNGECREGLGDHTIASPIIKNHTTARCYYHFVPQNIYLCCAQWTKEAIQRNVAQHHLTVSILSIYKHRHTHFTSLQYINPQHISSPIQMLPPICLRLAWLILTLTLGDPFLSFLFALHMILFNLTWRGVA